jgi:hypothetical protein
MELPYEIITAIIAETVALNAPYGWRTYHSLIRVSFLIQRATYMEYLPRIPIMLHKRHQVDSFEALLKSHPELAQRVRNIWFVAGIEASEECKIGGAILRACTNVTHMACKINLLRSLIHHDSFSPSNLVDLTLIENRIPWREIFTSDNGRKLFSQLTHFRSCGGNQFVIPKFCFASLTHLSLACHGLSNCCAPWLDPSLSPFTTDCFPALQQVVPTIPYLDCRYSNARRLRTEGLKIDPRVNAIPCPKKWKEADVWEDSRWGTIDLWQRARRGDDVAESRDHQLSREAAKARLNLADIYDEYELVLKVMEA